MRIAVALAALAAVLATVTGCSASCMDGDFEARALGSAAYAASGVGAGAGEAHGAVPFVLGMRHFDPFCDGYCDYEGTFVIELGPRCHLRAIATSRKYDTGKQSSKDFLQAEARIPSGQMCELRLDGERRVAGTVQSGGLTITPRGADLTVALQVDAWGERASGGFFRIDADGRWM